MVLYLTNDSPQREREILREISQGSIDGLLVCVSSMSDQDDLFQEVIDNGIPIVFFDRVASGIRTSKIMQDDFNGAYQAVEHLIDSGYKKIAHIAVPFGMFFTEKRMEGYLAALKAHNMEVNKECVIHSGFTQRDGEADML